jgi:hypothetical protein
VFSTFSSDGHEARWHHPASDDHETLTLHWENEGWTAQGIVRGANVHYVVRLSARWQVQQILVFRDLDEPDLWLATDGAGRWGEVNGAHRPDLDGGTEVWFDITRGDPAARRAAAETLSPFPATITMRRLAAETQMRVGEAAQVTAIAIDVETLGVTRRALRYVRAADRRWMVSDDHHTTSYDTDEHGLPFDVHTNTEQQAGQDVVATFRRLA